MEYNWDKRRTKVEKYEDQILNVLSKIAPYHKM